MRNWLLALAALPLTLCASLSASASQSVSLAWNPSTNSSTAGYAVYAGRAIGNYTSGMDVGTNTTVTITGLKEGTTNFFAVSAYDNTAHISGPISPPITYIVPGLLVMSRNSSTANPPSITFPTAVGHWYEIQASTNLATWSNIFQTTAATTNVWASYADPKASSLRRRFYRLVMH